MKAKPGTYILIMESPYKADIKVGRWGNLKIKPGYYIYVGSAFGPGGVKARVSRHWRESKSMHWHIDYLRNHVKPVCTWYNYGSRSLEHEWAQILLDQDNIDAIKGFGCSDCRCFTHLFSTIEKPDLAHYSKLIGQSLKSSEYLDSGSKSGMTAPAA